MIHGQFVAAPASSTPDSPPSMTASKSSKSSSFHSLHSDVLADAGHFEDIGLEDDGAIVKTHSYFPFQPVPSPVSTSTPTYTRNLANGKRSPNPKRSISKSNGHLQTSNPRSTNLAVITDPDQLALPRRISPRTLPSGRNRSTSPILLSKPGNPKYPTRPRRGSWQSNRDRKSLAELEHECDEDDGDDIPDDIVLDNVPISPRPAHERSLSRSPSVSPCRDHINKERVRSVGNGTPSVAQDRGCLRSPSWRSDTSDSSSLKSRAHSWNAALAELSAEAKALTEKLEEHADDLEEQYARQPSLSIRPNTWNSSQTNTPHVYDKRERVKSSTPELPPLRRTHAMVDPLPISKEKEAVLSRTRPSWLPPKDPGEERRHLREYQKMMAASARADERREAARRVKTESRDSNAGSLMHIWEDDIVPRWNDAIRERRTREMWWRGIAPRSRGIVWTRAIGNELGISDATFNTALLRAREVEARARLDKGSTEDIRVFEWLERIRRDASERTWTELRIFNVGGPLHQALVDVLSAYALYRNDIGYVPGCNNIAALLLLNLPNPESSFVALANVLNRPLPLSFYASDQGAQASAYNLVIQTLRLKSSALHEHLTTALQDVDPGVYLGDVFTGIFTGHLAVDEAARLWDVYVFEGDALLVRAAVALLVSHEMALLGSATADEVKSAISRPHSKTSLSRTVRETEAEDRFMKLVRGAGKA